MKSLPLVLGLALLGLPNPKAHAGVAYTPYIVCSPPTRPNPSTGDYGDVDMLFHTILVPEDAWTKTSDKASAKGLVMTSYWDRTRTAQMVVDDAQVELAVDQNGNPISGVVRAQINQSLEVIVLNLQGGLSEIRIRDLNGPGHTFFTDFRCQMTNSL